MPKKKTKILLLILIIIDLISISAFIFIFIFTKNLIAESVSKEDQIKMELKKESAAVLMKDDLAQGKNYQAQMMNYVVASDGTVAFIELLEKIVNNNNLKLNIRNVTTEPYKKSNNSTVELLRISIDVTGEWKNVYYFLSTLENYPLQIDINKLSINKFDDTSIKGKKVPQWSGSFDFTVVKIKEVK